MGPLVSEPGTARQVLLQATEVRALTGKAPPWAVLGCKPSSAQIPAEADSEACRARRQERETLSHATARQVLLEAMQARALHGQAKGQAAPPLEAAAAEERRRSDGEPKQAILRANARQVLLEAMQARALQGKANVHRAWGSNSHCVRSELAHLIGMAASVDDPEFADVQAGLNRSCLEVERAAPEVTLVTEPGSSREPLLIAQEAEACADGGQLAVLRAEVEEADQRCLRRTICLERVLQRMARTMLLVPVLHTWHHCATCREMPSQVDLKVTMPEQLLLPPVVIVASSTAADALPLAPPMQQITGGTAQKRASCRRWQQARKRASRGLPLSSQDGSPRRASSNILPAQDLAIEQPDAVVSESDAVHPSDGSAATPQVPPSSPEAEAATEPPTDESKAGARASHCQDPPSTNGSLLLQEGVQQDLQKQDQAQNKVVAEAFNSQQQQKEKHHDPDPEPGPSQGACQEVPVANIMPSAATEARHGSQIEETAPSHEQGGVHAGASSQGFQKVTQHTELAASAKARSRSRRGQPALKTIAKLPQLLSRTGGQSGSAQLQVGDASRRSADAPEAVEEGRPKVDRRQRVRSAAPSFRSKAATSTGTAAAAAAPGRSKTSPPEQQRRVRGQHSAAAAFQGDVGRARIRSQSRPVASTEEDSYLLFPDWGIADMFTFADTDAAPAVSAPEAADESAAQTSYTAGLYSYFWGEEEESDASEYYNIWGEDQNNEEALAKRTEEAQTVMELEKKRKRPPRTRQPANVPQDAARNRLEARKKGKKKV